MKAVSLALVSLFALAQAHGPFWGTNKCYSNPDNCDNKCTEEQKRGFDWTGLSTGSFSSYGGFHFSGWTCSSHFSGASPHNNGGKCIEGTISKSSSSSTYHYKGSSGSGPSFSCGAHNNGFSITSLHLSTDVDTEVQVLYGMPDGSTCRNTAHCSSSGVHLTNDQCGGATSVSFELPDSSSHKHCSLGIHSVGFDCSPAKTTWTATEPWGHSTATTWTGMSTATSPAMSKPTETMTWPSKVTETMPSSAAAHSTGGSSSSSSSSSSGASAVTTSHAMTSAHSSPSVHFTTSTVYTTSEVTITSCAPTVTNCPAESTITVTSTMAVSTTICPVTATETTAATATTMPTVPSSVAAVTGSASSETSMATTQTMPTGTGMSSMTTMSPMTTMTSMTTSKAPLPTEVITTVVTYETTTICPVTATLTSAGKTITSVSTTVSKVTVTSTSTICTACHASATSTSMSAPPPPPPPSCPKTVPQCINTWLYLVPECSSNSDVSCFCPSSEFTSKVMSCIESWSSSKAEIQQALSYLTGICASSIPQNPAIVTAIPTTITLAPSGVSAATATSGAAGVSSAAAAVSVPCTTITYSTYTLTVPQVAFTTGGSTVGLVVGTGTAAASVAVPTGVAAVTASSTMPAGGAGPSSAAAVFAGSSSTLATMPVPMGTGSMASKTTTASSPPLFTGAASGRVQAVVSVSGLGAWVGLLAMLL